MNETIRLGDIAHARSGDKGRHANIGVIAWNAAGFEFLDRSLTETRVAEFLLPLRPRGVERFPLPGIHAFNFVVRDVLDGGAGTSLRSDAQGKTLALVLLELMLPRPADWPSLQPEPAG